jgi:hypothetical protein
MHLMMLTARDREAVRKGGKGGSSWPIAQKRPIA